jgi:hypothetical protein
MNHDHDSRTVLALLDVADYVAAGDDAACVLVLTDLVTETLDVPPDQVIPIVRLVLRAMFACTEVVSRRLHDAALEETAQ